MEPPNTLPYHLPSDAVWFITGCSSGIGLALAHFISQTQNRVVATARNVSSLSSLPENERVLKLKLDVTSIDSINSAFDAVLEKFGRVDVIVNNAGYGLVGITEVAGDEESRALFDTNFWGMVDVSKRAIGILRDVNAKNGQQGGLILNISSMGGWMGFANCPFYHATKFAMEGWTEAVAKELPSLWNIHLSNIEPGGVKTKWATDSLKHIAKRHPAYDDPSFPANVINRYTASEEGRKLWAEPSSVAAAIYRVASQGKRIPIRVPLGSDAWGMILRDLDDVRKDLEESKDISLSVGDPKQIDTIDFLKQL
ncbi:NAD(P)-binding protein [Xylaria intraflava]|nr:NAD(P)-binding protein [Xylaria intraflava]